jgi:two-component system, NtrC family, sensor kinase
LKFPLIRFFRKYNFVLSAKKSEHSSSANQAKNNSTDEFYLKKALMERPRFSIRFRIILAFLLAFFFSFGIAIGSIIFISRLDSKYTFFEEAENFSSDIQQARRYEKNFFLYGSKNDLYDALNYIESASNLLSGTSTEIRSVFQHQDFELLTADLHDYQRLLTEMVTFFDQQGATKNFRNPELEDQLRIHGHSILFLSSALVQKERIKVHRATRSFMIIAIFLVGINLLVMIWVATELTSQIVQPLGRFVGYTNRIATGDFSPITPKRKYRDEFSKLAIAINHMLYELKEKQEQLIQSRKMAAVGTLTSGIAHELNNPLNNISLTTEALLEGIDDYTNENKRKMLQDIFTQVERASGTVRNLLDFTREEQPRRESIDVQELIGSSLKLVSNELLIHNIKVETQFDANLKKATGSFRNLQQVFLNLFLNSIQAMSIGGKLRIRTAMESDNSVRVDVEDTGCGIPKEHFEKIFDPFFTTKEVGKGTGLGLSVSYGIIQKMGGRISVDSEVGKGSVFSVYLPSS